MGDQQACERTRQNCTSPECGCPSRSVESPAADVDLTQWRTSAVEVVYRMRADGSQEWPIVDERDSLLAQNAEERAEKQRYIAWYYQTVDERNSLLAQNEALTKALRDLHNEVDCRIEHGAQSGHHLEYVRARLAAALSSSAAEDDDNGT